MNAQIIDGKKIAEDIRQELREEIKELNKKGVVPGLAAILVGENPASVTYVRMKEKACRKLEIFTQTIRKAVNISQQELLKTIDELKEDDRIHGILVQLPLPAHIDEKAIIKSIPPWKDVDGFHPMNWGKMLWGEETFLPCTPAGIQELLVRSGNSPEGKHVVIVGRSHIVGLPLANLLLQKTKGANATVTVCHTGTSDLANFSKQADILIAAVGRPEAIYGEMLKDGSVVIDVGVNRVEDSTTEKGYRIVGDVHFSSAVKKAKAISPVPGGVGPMTIVMLLKNTIKAARLACG